MLDFAQNVFEYVRHSPILISVRACVCVIVPSTSAHVLAPVKIINFYPSSSQCVLWPYLRKWKYRKHCPKKNKNVTGTAS